MTNTMSINHPAVLFNKKNFVEVEIPLWLGWRQGTRSSIKKYIDKNTGEAFLEKKIPAKHQENAYVELSVINVFKRHDDTKDIFCSLIDHKHLKNNLVSIFDVGKSDSLDKIAESKAKIEVSELLPALQPVVSLHKAIKYLDEIENELRKLSENKISKIEEITAEECAKKFVRYADPNNKLTKHVREYIKNAYFELAAKYFTSRDLIQNDGYPWHNKLNQLIDGGEIKIGPGAWHLACLIGHPIIYDKLEKKEENIRDLAHHYVFLYQHPPEKAEKIEKGFYVFSVYGNYRLLGGRFSDRFSRNEKIKLKAAALDQLTILGKEESAAKKLLNTLKYLP